jgi:hypothetical protein
MYFEPSLRLFLISSFVICLTGMLSPPIPRPGSEAQQPGCLEATLRISIYFVICLLQIYFGNWTFAKGRINCATFMHLRSIIDTAQSHICQGVIEW